MADEPKKDEDESEEQGQDVDAPDLPDPSNSETRGADSLPFEHKNK